MATKRRASAFLTACVIALVVTHASMQDASVSPAEQRMAWAQRTIGAQPKEPQGHIDLALALARRARETGDASYYARATEALAPALAVDSKNFDANKVQLWIAIGEHDFIRARDAAVALNKRMPDDVSVYGFVADANVGLGNYREAEDAVQWMLDMRPKNPAGLARTATLRELFGDVEGALEMFGNALTATVSSEVEDRAWLLSQMGHLYLSTGHAKEAEAALQQALTLFPRYHYALRFLAQVRVSEQRYQDAVDVLKSLCAAVPRAENLYALAEALELAKSPDAGRAYAEFERKALDESQRLDNANRQLIAYYSDRVKNPREALRLAELEYSRNHDVYTLDAYAWALAQNNQNGEAQKQLDTALAVGIQDAELLYHAGVIASKLRDRDKAVRFLKKSLELNSQSRVAAASQRALTELSGSKPASKPSAR